MKKPPVKNHHNDQNEFNGPPTASQMEMMWSGPLPPPQVLQSFNDVVPDGAERIMRAWEKETDHRHHMDRKQSTLYAAEAIIGKIFAFLFVLTALGVCGYAASVGADWVASIIGAGVIGSVVWAFVKVSREQKNGNH